MVVAFERPRARECKTCTSPCNDVCPMRLQPRNIKRMMFSCVQCGQCLQACEQSQTAQARTPVLEWKVGADAVRETLRQRNQGHR
jgi:flavoprotein